MEKNKGALLRGTNLEPRDITPTLADLGLDKKISKLAQDISSLSSGEPGDFDKLKKGKTTISKVRAKLRKKKQIKKEKN